MTSAPHPWPGFLPPQSWRGADMFYIAKKLGLAANLRLCLDSGDAASLPAASTKWLDLSGNGYDFNFGATTAAPTINGAAGARSSSEYLSFDGGDSLDYDTTNEAWMETIHKAGATFTFVVWAYLISGLNQGIISTHDGNTLVGFDFRVSTTLVPQLVVGNGSANTTISGGTSVGGTGAWHMLALSLAEIVGANGAAFFDNGTFTLRTSTYTSPAASAAAIPMTLGRRNGASFPLTNTSRLAAILAWDRALTQDQLRSLFFASRGRFGI